MVLFNIEYEVFNGMTFKCDVVGVDEQDVINDLTLQVGVIKVISLYRKSGVDRITQGIRNKIIDGKNNTPTKKKNMGRPRLPDE